MDINIFQNEMPQIISAFAGAFFAFVFFVVGESWFASTRKRDEFVFTLDVIKEYIAFQIFTLEANIKIAQGISVIEKPISIHIDRFQMSPIENQIYSKLRRYKVTSSILEFVVHLKALNESVITLNTNLQELSNISKVAMLEQREVDFKETMDQNLIDLKDKIERFSKHLKSTRSKITPLINEINFTLWYEQSYFWQKIYFRFRQRLDLTYRDKIIKKISK